MDGGGSLLTGTRSIGHDSVTIETVALVASIAVHAAMFTGTGFKAALVQIYEQESTCFFIHSLKKIFSSFYIYRRQVTKHWHI